MRWLEALGTWIYLQWYLYCPRFQTIRLTRNELEQEGLPGTDIPPDTQVTVRFFNFFGKTTFAREQHDHIDS